MSDIYNLLKELRGNRSLREISKLSGISHSYLSILEKGVDPRNNKPIQPSNQTLKQLAIVYNYPYEKLLESAGLLDNHLNDYDLKELILYCNIKYNNKVLNDNEKDLLIRFLELVINKEQN